MAELLGTEIAEGFFNEGIKADIPDTNVGVLVKGNNHLYPKSDKRRRKGETLWQQALEHFPILRGVKPVGRSNIGVNESNQTYHAWDSYSNTWRNPQNANNKRRQTYLGLVPILNGAGPWFTRDVPLDDLADDVQIKKRHEALLTAVKRKREGGQCFSIDNLLAKGVLAYIANAPLKGFEAIDDPVAWLVSSLKAIRPPGHVSDLWYVSDSDGGHCISGKIGQLVTLKPLSQAQHLVNGLVLSPQAVITALGPEQPYRRVFSIYAHGPCCSFHHEEVSSFC